MVESARGTLARQVLNYGVRAYVAPVRNRINGFVVLV